MYRHFPKMKSTSALSSNVPLAVLSNKSKKKVSSCHRASSMTIKVETSENHSQQLCLHYQPYWTDHSLYSTLGSEAL